MQCVNSFVVGLLCSLFASSADGYAFSLRSRNDIRVDSKPVSLCETTAGVENHAGYIRLKPGVLADYGIDNAQDFPVNTFFWYFQNRKRRTDAPLTVYFMGGPGASSLMSLFRENGPCRVNADSNGTHPNRWSWNEETDILYIDQPVQTGFSYDTIEPGILTAEGELMLDKNFSGNVSDVAATSRRGVFSSQEPNRTLNSTQLIAESTWIFLQAWLQKFQHRKANNNQINFWTSSYGGHFVPKMIRHALDKNKLLATGKLDKTEFVPMDIGALGMTNACVDGPIQLPYYPEMALNNNYSVPLTNSAEYDRAIFHLKKEDGCLAKVQKCRNAAAEGVSRVEADGLCQDANSYCSKHVVSIAKGRSYFDIAYPEDYLSDQLSENYFGFLNQKHVQEALGVPVNFSANAPVVANAFSLTGDNVKGGALEALAGIMDAGVSVTMMYGDRDFACNWLGGEAVSHSIPFADSSTFSSTGIADLTIPGFPVGAQVRQAGALSFVRIYAAGHNVGLFQPQLAHVIFNRTILGLDIATGSTRAGAGRSYTSGNTYHVWEHSSSSPPFGEDAACYTWNLGLCSDEHRAMYLDGTAKVQDYFVVEDRRGRCVPNPVRPCTHQQGWRGDKLGETKVNYRDRVGEEGTRGRHSLLLLFVLLSTSAGCIACLRVLLSR